MERIVERNEMSQRPRFVRLFDMVGKTKAKLL